MTAITHTTTGATGIANDGVGGANGLPAGVSATWASNTITISGTPTASGTFNYSILLTGGCGTVNATGTIIVTPDNTAGVASSSPTLCINTALTAITHTTTGATGIANDGVDGANGLPAGVAATWASDTISISGTPTTSGTFNYTIPLTGGCDSINATGTITVEPEPIAGSVVGGTSVCPGTTSGLLTLTNYTVTATIVRWESSVSPFTTWSSISNTVNTYTSGVLTETTHFRAVIQNGSCPVVYSAYTSVEITTTTYKLPALPLPQVPYWDNGTPDDGTKSARIETSYISAGNNIDACSLTVIGATVVISSGDTVTLSGILNATGSFVTFNNNANLIQTSNVANIGPIIINRNSSPLYRLDYTLWSSPVTSTQSLQSFSPQTLSNRFYTYKTTGTIGDVTINTYVPVASPSATPFEKAKGYLIRMPNNWPAYVFTDPQVIGGTPWAGSFTGVPNNGIVPFTMVVGPTGERFNAVGNPYPSPINAFTFLNETTNAVNTTQTIYILRKTNYYLARSSYCTANFGGTLWNGEPSMEADFNYDNWNGVIKVGQGFIIEASGTGTDLVFNNSMRIDDHTSRFFRNPSVSNSTIERNRIWLNATNSSGMFSQTMVGYLTGATQGIDNGFDGSNINDGPLILTSLIDTLPFAIQCRSLPFDTSDSVPMSFKVTAAGDYSIAIDHVDGLFTGGAQPIYLKDNLTTTVHDLNTGAYTFASDAGTFNSRFEIVYALPLGVDNPVFTANNVIIYSQNNVFVVNSGAIIMDSIKVFDIRGRLLETKKGINASETTIVSGLANEVLLVQMTSEDGVVVTKKVVR